MDNGTIRVSSVVDLGAIQSGMPQAASLVEQATARMVEAFVRAQAASKAASQSVLVDWAGRPLATVTADAEKMGSSLAGAGEHTVSSSREAREAIRGLGEEVGVHLPRFVSSFLAGLGPVSGIMSAAFAPIAVVGLVEVLAKIPDALEKGIDWLHGWTAQAKEAFEESTKAAVKWQTDVIDMQSRLRAVQLIGVEGMKKYGLESALNTQNINEVSAALDRLQVQASKAHAVLIDAGKEARAPGSAGFDPEDLKRRMTPYGARESAPSNQDVEKAQAEIKELEPAIESLKSKLTDLSIKAKEIPAEAAAAAAKTAEESMKKAEEAAKRSQELMDRWAKERWEAFSKEYAKEQELKGSEAAADLAAAGALAEQQKKTSADMVKSMAELDGLRQKDAAKVVEIQKQGGDRPLGSRPGTGKVPRGADHHGPEGPPGQAEGD